MMTHAGATQVPLHKQRKGETSNDKWEPINPNSSNKQHTNKARATGQGVQQDAPNFEFRNSDLCTTECE